jgi:hypothetical protein
MHRHIRRFIRPFKAINAHLQSQHSTKSFVSIEQIRLVGPCVSTTFPILDSNYELADVALAGDNVHESEYTESEIIAVYFPFDEQY